MSSKKPKAKKPLAKKAMKKTQGGAGFIKFDGVDGEIEAPRPKIHTYLCPAT
ncbi:MAG TPA: hypothetical protein VF950_09430 [Planctomycetota bacterium]